VANAPSSGIAMTDWRISPKKLRVTLDHKAAFYISMHTIHPLVCVVAQDAKQAGTLISADIDNVYDGLPALLPYIDILLGSKEFPHRVTGIVDPMAALVELQNRYGSGIVGMTLGDQGAVIYCEGQFLKSPAYTAPGGCKDTTGAGDAFRGGFLYGMLSGEDIETSMKFGNAVAAMKCSALGARPGLPTLQQLKTFLG
jgi:Sugar kinases, ribokinase family